MFRHRSTGVLLAALSVLGLVAVASPASAAVFNDPIATSSLACTHEDDPFPTWSFQLTNPATSSTPVAFVVDVDGVEAFNGSLAVNDHTEVLTAPVTHAGPSTLTVLADGNVLAHPVNSAVCGPEATGKITFSCVGENNQLLYEVDKGKIDQAVFDLVLSDGSLVKFPVLEAGPHYWNDGVKVGTTFDASITIDGQVLDTLHGTAADCLPTTTTTDPDVPATTPAPPTTVAAPPAEVLSAQATPTLPRTGSTTGPLAAAGIASLVLGAALVLGSRRRLARP